MTGPSEVVSCRRHAVVPLIVEYQLLYHDATDEQRRQADHLWQRVRNDRTLTVEVGDRAAGWLGLPATLRGSDVEQCREVLETVRSQQ